MQTARGKLHLEIQTSRKNPVVILRTSFRENGKIKHTQHERWIFRGVIDCLAQITRNRVTVNGAEFYQNSTPTEEQEQILRLLEVKM